MKKLVMMCAIVAAAVSAQAASFTWGGAIAAEDGTSEPNAGSVAYLLYSDSAFGTISKFYADTKTTDVGGTLRQSYTITAADASAFGFEETGPRGGTCFMFLS